MDINEINRIVNLIKKVNCELLASVAETAKEMGVKKTALMQFIEDHPLLFITAESKKGLMIQTVFIEESQNPKSDSWLEMKKKEWENKIQVFGKYYYGYHEFDYIESDGDDEYRKSQWRNTPEKIQTLVDAGVIKKQSCCYGGISDCYNWEGYLLTSDVAKQIEDLGWELVYPDTTQS